ncbi:hypothetical protein [Natrinema sp. 1APR25-10V2]|uniref:hypothetical protein n=1 Tax=Natrinema sp. 1APR25-10V2 TaxID=2951081 RepID=UPI0028768020|nr:hypothetical protein [Natrinema sp. 1APR25-10V2]MDS0476407.1 hypothetical protein [Natrinema sp. 1APR25-10V2]
MKRTTLIAVALAALLMITGFAAAAPGNAPVSVDTDADSTDEQPANERAQSADERDDRSENGAAADTGADDRNGQGPNVDLPDQVPDHVSEIHDRISSFLSGTLDGSLGDAISDVTPADGDEENADDTSDDDTSDDDTSDNDTSDDDTESTDE